MAHEDGLLKLREANVEGIAIDLDKCRYSNKYRRACSWLEIIVIFSCRLQMSPIFILKNIESTVRLFEVQ